MVYDVSQVDFDHPDWIWSSARHAYKYNTAIHSTCEIENQQNTYSCNGAAEAAQPALSPSVESEEGQDMYAETMAHFLQLFIIDFENNRIFVQFSQLTDLKRERERDRDQDIFEKECVNG